MMSPVDDPSRGVPDDAQRDLERRALRNVRSLVDNLQARDRTDNRRALRLFAAVLAGTAIVAGLGYVVLRMALPPAATREITTTAPRVPDAPRVTPR